MKHVNNAVETNEMVNKRVQTGAWQSLENKNGDGAVQLEQQYRELIKDAMWRKETSESFHSFVETIQWSESA